MYKEVGVGKREVQETLVVSGTVRREEARIEREGDVKVGGSSWEQALPGYGQTWQQHYGATDYSWEDAEPGYRYAHETEPTTVRTEADVVIGMNGHLAPQGHLYMWDASVRLQRDPVFRAVERTLH